MALTLIGARLGEVVDKVTQASPPASFTGATLKLVAADVDIGAAADYTVASGFLGLAAIIGVSAIAWASGVVRAEAGTIRAFTSLWNTNTNGLMFYEVNVAVAGTPEPLNEIETADLTAGDNLRIVAVCY
jgi:hypothetical protein